MTVPEAHLATAGAQASELDVPLPVDVRVGRGHPGGRFRARSQQQEGGLRRAKRRRRPGPGRSSALRILWRPRDTKWPLAACISRWPRTSPHTFSGLEKVRLPSCSFMLVAPTGRSSREPLEAMSAAGIQPESGHGRRGHHVPVLQIGALGDVGTNLMVQGWLDAGSACSRMRLAHRDDRSRTG